MKKRMTLMVLAVVIFLTAIGAVKYGQVKKAIAQHSSSSRRRRPSPRS